MSLSVEKSPSAWGAESTFEPDKAEVIDGLRKDPKRISAKYFYDQRGSELFDEICNLPEYYPTSAEQTIMAAHLPEIAALVGPGAAIIEFGAGSNAKARQLLNHLESPLAYVPVDISGNYLSAQLDELAGEFPSLSIQPVVADFTKPFELPDHLSTPKRNLVFFPGSTIGNFTKPDAQNLLEVMRSEARPGGALLIGVDLIKNRNVIHAAYNDSQGITAEFNLNALRHLNSSFDGDFQSNHFRHEAVYDDEQNRVEMRLVSLTRHTVTLCGESIEFGNGEHIVTEYSHKYSIKGFAELAKAAGWKHEAVWTDPGNLFSVHYLIAP
jgi:dimethylhistidine N-methyltransferase